MATSSATTVGFLALYPMDEATNDRIAAILVTDLDGVPREFRCTERIKPTKLQAAVYGATLDGYVAIEIAGKPLLQACTEKPVALFVNDRNLTGLRTAIMPVVFVPTGESSSTDESVDDPSGAMTLLSRDDGGQLDPLEALERVSNAVDVLLAEDKRFG